MLFNMGYYDLDGIPFKQKQFNKMNDISERRISWNDVQSPLNQDGISFNKERNSYIIILAGHSEENLSIKYDEANHKLSISSVLNKELEGIHGLKKSVNVVLSIDKDKEIVLTDVSFMDGVLEIKLKDVVSDKKIKTIIPNVKQSKVEQLNG